MQTEKINSRLTAGILGAFAAFGGIGCMVTGMYFDKISMVTVAVACILTAAVCAATAGRRLFPIAPALLGLVCLGAWLRGTLALSAEAFLNHISHLYDLGYGWGVIRWSSKPISPDMAQQALCILGSFLAMGVTWSFLRCKGIWLTAVLAAAPVVPCMILIDTIPAAPYLFIQLLCLVLLLLIRLARKRGQGMALLKLLVLPAALALLVLFVSMPRRSYTSLPWVDGIIGHVQEYFADSGKKTPQALVLQESDWINLTSVGPKQEQQTPVMEVLTQQTGRLYLKGAAYDTYRGTRWDSAGITANQPPSATRILSVLITTEALHDVLFLPYGAYSIPSADAADRITEKDGRVDNPNRWRTYTIRYNSAPDFEESWQWPASPSQQFTLLPTDTLKAAKEYLSRELPELDTIEGVWNKAKAIADHVSRSARYSLDTRKMPKARDDFALWFLEESDTGYCIHFASATTVLLRAAGIPARYVTGYLVNARANRIAQVTQGDAHAWAECYVAGVGWVPLEATPGYDASHTGENETTAPTEEPAATQNTEIQETLGQQPSDPQSSSTAPVLPTEQPSQNTSAIGGANKPVPPQRQSMPLWLKWGFGMLCAVGAVTAQWRLRILLRQKKRHRGKRNAQALARWQEVVLHCRVRRIQPDPGLHELAQKARFSHHALTREELMVFDDWLERSKANIRQLSLWQRFLATILFALY